MKRACIIWLLLISSFWSSGQLSDTLNVKLHSGKYDGFKEITLAYDINWRPGTIISFSPFDLRAFFTSDAAGPFTLSGEVRHHISENLQARVDFWTLGQDIDYKERSGIETLRYGQGELGLSYTTSRNRVESRQRQKLEFANEKTKVRKRLPSIRSHDWSLRAGVLYFQNSLSLEQRQVDLETQDGSYFVYQFQAVRDLNGYAGIEMTSIRKMALSSQFFKGKDEVIISKYYVDGILKLASAVYGELHYIPQNDLESMYFLESGKLEGYLTPGEFYRRNLGIRMGTSYTECFITNPAVGWTVGYELSLFPADALSGFFIRIHAGLTFGFNHFQAQVD